MPRLEGEDAEAYRTRISMSGIIFEWGGTRQGILYVLAALGYEQSRIEPAYQQDPERWAEFIVHLGPGNANAVKSPHAIFNEIQKVKEASSRLAGVEFFLDTEPASLNIAAFPELIGDLEVWPLVVNELESAGAMDAGGVVEYHAALEVRTIENRKEEKA